jgi:hypothetical protein
MYVRGQIRPQPFFRKIQLGAETPLARDWEIQTLKFAQISSSIELTKHFCVVYIEISIFQREFLPQLFIFIK